MTKYQKTQLQLPQNVVDAFVGLPTPRRNQYIAALRTQGWTLQSLSEAAGVTRERVRQIVAKEEAQPTLGHITGPLPLPPEVVAKPPREFTEPEPETLARLLELYPKAKLVRANSANYREEAEEFTALLAKAHAPVTEGGEGVPLYRLGLRLNLSHAALRFRLSRYGYKTSTSTSTAYAPILEKNRARI